jgi:hypothetical protein
MAKGTMTISDTKAGGVEVVFKFSPCLRSGRGMTKAQALVVSIAESMGGETVAQVTNHLKKKAKS